MCFHTKQSWVGVPPRLVNWAGEFHETICSMVSFHLNPGHSGRVRSCPVESSLAKQEGLVTTRYLTRRDRLKLHCFLGGEEQKFRQCRTQFLGPGGVLS